MRRFVLNVSYINTGTNTSGTSRSVVLMLNPNAIDMNTVLVNVNGLIQELGGAPGFRWTSNFVRGGTDFFARFIWNYGNGFVRLTPA